MFAAAMASMIDCFFFSFWACICTGKEWIWFFFFPFFLLHFCRISFASTIDTNLLIMRMTLDCCCFTHLCLYFCPSPPPFSPSSPLPLFPDLPLPHMHPSSSTMYVNVHQCTEYIVHRTSYIDPVLRKVEWTKTLNLILLSTASLPLFPLFPLLFQAIGALEGDSLNNPRTTGFRGKPLVEVKKANANCPGVSLVPSRVCVLWNRIFHLHTTVIG